MLTKIHQSTPIFIAIDGSKFETKSEGAWVIFTLYGKKLAHRSNPDYDSIENMHSYRSDMYAILSVLLFLKEYPNFYNLSLHNKLKIYSNHKEITTKITKTKKRVTITTKHIKFPNTRQS